MDWAIIMLTVLVIVAGGHGSGGNDGEILKEMGRVTGLVLRDCWTRAGRAAKSDDDPDELVALMIPCLQRRTLLALGRALSSDVIPLTDTVQLVRFWPGTNDSANSSYNRNRSDFMNDIFYVLTNLFKTHTIRINVEDDIAQQGRIRKKHGIMPILLFGLLGLGMILVPMGFQFLAVLGGKALLLAKMALMLTSIQGLKKVATSNVHYGFYHTPPSAPWFDRKTEDHDPHQHRLEDYYVQIPGPGAEYVPYVKRVSHN